MKTNLYRSSLFLLAILLFTAGCSKDYESIEVVDDANIQTYIKSNNLNVTQYKDSGFYYEVLNQGTGDTLSYSDRVFVTFTMKSLDGSFNLGDMNNNRYTSFLGYFSTESNLPAAFRTAVKEILNHRGSSIRLIIPSRLAYGKAGNGTFDIKGNASLDCTIKVFDAKSVTEFEDVFVKEYIQSNNITGLSRLNSGVYYKVLTQGTGTVPVDVDSYITVAYTGKLTNGTVFDSSTSFPTYLSGVIPGWQQGVPLITTGGKIRLIIPPTLGYGSSGSGTVIPGNSILDFEIELKAVTN